MTQITYFHQRDKMLVINIDLTEFIIVTRIVNNSLKHN